MPVNQVATGREPWVMVASPLVWATHFLASYATAAIWCAKIGGPLRGARVAIAAYTVVALLAVAAIGWRGLVHARLDGVGGPADRQRFLGVTTLLLSILSAIAIAYSALAPLFVAACP
jgi:hypothetical protein